LQSALVPIRQLAFLHDTYFFLTCSSRYISSRQLCSYAIAESMQRSISEAGRAMWFASLAPNETISNFEDFQVGLEVDDEIFATVEELVDQAYETYSLDNKAILPGGPDYQDAVAEAAAALLEIFEEVPVDWITVWCEALILDTWNKRRAEEEEVRYGKKPSPPLEDSPTTGKEVLRFSQKVPPNPTLSQALEQKEKAPIPIGERTIALRMLVPDQPLEEQHSANIFEIIAVQCVPKGQDSEQIKNYKLELFVRAFEDIINANQPNEPYTLAYGKVAYTQISAEKRRFGDQKVRIIRTQANFEMALSYLIENHGDILPFEYFEQRSREKKRRVKTEKKLEDAVKAANLLNTKNKEGREKALEVRKKEKDTKAEASALRKAQAASATPREPPRKPLPDASGSTRRTKRPPLPASTQSRTNKPGLVDYLQMGTPSRIKPIRSYSPASSPSAIEKTTLAPEHGSAPNPRDTPPLPLHRKRASRNLLAETTKAGRNINGSIVKPSTHSGRTAPTNRIVEQPQKEKGQTEPHTEEKEVKKEPSFRKIRVPSLELHQLRRNSGFYPQSPSAAIRRRSSIASRASRKASMSLQSIPGLKKIFNRAPKDLPPPPEEQDNFYAEILRRTFTRGGDTDREISIDQITKNGKAERPDEHEVEEPELADDFESPEEHLITQ
jgi:hypothetical protein